tara:strand:- start:2221 stop:3012 length:792 start_codon:yes stop_codon:yes gene_type:complete
MLKKRMIFTLLFHNGDYMLSRNFKLQKVGNLDWLKKNYNFTKISFAIDELIVLNVTRSQNKETDLFLSHLRELTKMCFIPIASGGGIISYDYAKALLRNGADKVVVNTSLALDEKLIYKLAEEFGSQCIVASVDIKTEGNNYRVWINNGSTRINSTAEDYLKKIATLPIGDIYFNSIDKDGTGQGYLTDILGLLPKNLEIPIIIAGGAGKYQHLAEGLKNNRVDAVATAHLFNFVGNGLINARNNLLDEGFELAKWDYNKSLK